MSGFKTQYHYLTLLVVSEFNEWRVLVYGAEVTIHGTHQFQDVKAKEHAIAIARKYVHEHKHDDLPVLTDLVWAPTVHDDWLIWSS